MVRPDKQNEQTLLLRSRFQTRALLDEPEMCIALGSRRVAGVLAANEALAVLKSIDLEQWQRPDGADARVAEMVKLAVRVVGDLTKRLTDAAAVTVPQEQGGER